MLGEAEDILRPLDDIVLDPFASPWRAAIPASTPAPEPASPAAAPEGFEARVRRFEAGLLSDALARHRFNQRRTAEQLGLSYDQLRHYLKKHGIAARPT